MIFCTGANGYIGGGILRAALRAGLPITGGVRTPRALPEGAAVFVTGDLAAGLSLPPVRAVVHAAGLGHRRGMSPDIWRRENVQAAVAVARAARAAGAETFILISTAYVHGRVHAGPVTEATALAPMDDYTNSKIEAEREAAAAFGGPFCALRPCAVIGPGCPGNIQLLIKLLRLGAPLPFGAIANRRSFIGRDDLAALVLALLAAPAMPPVVLAAHPEAISTPDLVRALAAGLGRPARLFRAPPALLAASASAVGRTAMWQSLAGDFIVTPDTALATGWVPTASLAAQLAETARYHDTTGPET